VNTLYQERPISVFCQRGVTQPAVERGTINEKGEKLNASVVERPLYHSQHSHGSLTLQFAATWWDLVIGAAPVSPVPGSRKRPKESNLQYGRSQRGTWFQPTTAQIACSLLAHLLASSSPSSLSNSLLVLMCQLGFSDSRVDSLPD
jgi:hypothetical protein